MKIKEHRNQSVGKKFLLLVSSLLISFSVFAQSELSIKTFPYDENFENQNDKIIMRKQAFSNVILDTRAASSGYNGLLFNGNNKTTDWIDSAGITTSLNAWVGNFFNIATASILIDGRKVSSLFCKLGICP